MVDDYRIVSCNIEISWNRWLQGILSLTDKSIEAPDIYFCSQSQYNYAGSFLSNSLIFYVGGQNLKKKSVLTNIGNKNCSFRDRGVWFLLKYCKWIQNYLKWNNSSLSLIEKYLALFMKLFFLFFLFSTSEKIFKQFFLKNLA